MVPWGSHPQPASAQPPSLRLLQVDLNSNTSAFPLYLSHIFQRTCLKRPIQPLNEVRPDQAMEIRPPVYTWRLAQHGFHPPIHRPDPEDVPAGVRRPPDPNLGAVDLRSALRVGNRVAEVGALLVRENFLPGRIW